MLVARPLSLTPRTGREHQRYEEGVRLVTGCVPFIRCADGTYKVVMVSSRNGNWIVPKGGAEEDETIVQSAAREGEFRMGFKMNVTPFHV